MKVTANQTKPDAKLPTGRFLVDGRSRDRGVLLDGFHIPYHELTKIRDGIYLIESAEREATTVLLTLRPA